MLLRSLRMAGGSILFLAVLLLFTPPTGAQAPGTFSVLFVELDSAISPVQGDLLRDAIAVAQSHDHGLVLIRLDTPGGLADSMRDMVQQILASPVPVAIWVGPSGARAASAGVFLVAASHVAAMSPQSTIGAASPVAMGGKEIDETMARKIKNDILSLVRGIAKARGRNVGWYIASVEGADSITAQEAVLNNVVDYVADSPEDLLMQTAQRGIAHQGARLTFDPATARIVPHDPGVRYTFLSWLLHPQVAYLLLLGGMAGLFFELSTPGAIFPGVFGGFCILLGLYALSVLPASAAGLMLIAFSFVLFLLELYVTSFGMLSVAALAALFTGSMILFPGAGTGFTLSLGLILSTVGTMAVLAGLAVYLVTRAQTRQPYQDSQQVIGQTATVRTWDKASGQVFLHGEVWSAWTEQETHFAEHSPVTIVSVDGLRLKVQRPGAGEPDIEDAPGADRDKT